MVGNGGSKSAVFQREKSGKTLAGDHFHAQNHVSFKLYGVSFHKVENSARKNKIRNYALFNKRSATIFLLWVLPMGYEGKKNFFYRDKVGKIFPI